MVKLTNQTAFDKAVKRMFDGNGKCSIKRREDQSEVPTCLYYRWADGNRCVVGAMMPLALAKALADHLADVSQLLTPGTPKYSPGADAILGHLDRGLLSALQDIHDNGYFVPETGLPSLSITKALRDLGKEYKLRLPKELC